MKFFLKMLCIYLAISRTYFLSKQQSIRGGIVNLTPNSCELTAPDGTKRSIKKYGKLYYLNYTNPNSGAYSAELWHKILGHCTMSDVFKLENVVEGMKITTKGKLECDKGKCPNIEIGNPTVVRLPPYS